MQCRSFERSITYVEQLSVAELRCLRQAIRRCDASSCRRCQCIVSGRCVLTHSQHPLLPFFGLLALSQSPHLPHPLFSSQQSLLAIGSRSRPPLIAAAACIAGGARPRASRATGIPAAVPVGAAVGRRRKCRVTQTWHSIWRTLAHAAAAGHFSIPVHSLFSEPGANRSFRCSWLDKNTCPRRRAPTWH